MAEENKTKRKAQKRKKITKLGKLEERDLKKRRLRHTEKTYDTMQEKNEMRI